MGGCIHEQKTVIRSIIEGAQVMITYLGSGAGLHLPEELEDGDPLRQQGPGSTGEGVCHAV